MHVYQVAVTLVSTAIAQAPSAAEAVALVRESLKDKILHMASTSSVPVSEKEMSDPNLPKFSMSPVLVVTEVDGEAVLAYVTKAQP